jgi:hypothetical protein
LLTEPAHFLESDFDFGFTRLGNRMLHTVNVSVQYWDTQTQSCEPWAQAPYVVPIPVAHPEFQRMR